MTGAQPFDLGGQLRGGGLDDRQLGVEQLARLHHLELLVLEIRAMTLQHVDVGLHRLELLRRVGRARVQAGVHLVGARPDRSGFVVEAPLVGEHDVATAANLARLGLPGPQLRQIGFELGPLGQCRAPVPQAIPRDVVLLYEQERFELFGTHVRVRVPWAVWWQASSPAGAPVWSAGAAAACGAP